MASDREMKIRITADTREFTRAIRRAQRMIGPSRREHNAWIEGSLTTIAALLIVHLWIGLNAGAFVGVAASDIVMYLVRVRRTKRYGR